MTRLRNLLLVLITLTLTAVSASAQPVADAKEAPTWLAAVLAILIVVVVALGSFMGSRRGHQD